MDMFWMENGYMYTLTREWVCFVTFAWVCFDYNHKLLSSSQTGLLSNITVSANSHLNIDFKLEIALQMNLTFWFLLFIPFMCFRWKYFNSQKLTISLCLLSEIHTCHFDEQNRSKLWILLNKSAFSNLLFFYNTFHQIAHSFTTVHTLFCLTKWWHRFVEITGRIWCRW